MSDYDNLDSAALQRPISEHGFISDQRSAALVTREGTIPWLCMPRFDSAALFASLLGTPKNGHWTLRIAGGEVVERSYLPGTLILRTHWRGPDGEAEVLDFMPVGPSPDTCALDAADRGDRSDLMRIVRCLSGEVEVEQCISIRFDYGARLPWVSRRQQADGSVPLVAIAGGDGVALHGEGLTAVGHQHRGRARLRAGEESAWTLTWFPGWGEPPAAIDPRTALEASTAHWREWLERTRPSTEYTEHVETSLLVLRGLTHRMTGGIVAAATASLPEDFGGERNWDYRFCWLRDASLSLEALLAHGHVAAAQRWRDWLLRAIAGDMSELQIMYTLSGGRSLEEKTLEHLPGYAASAPVRIGNGAVDQYQADVVGEVMLALAQLREAGVDEDERSWPLQRALVRYAVQRLDEKDQGLWEMRGEPQFFTHGRIMTWAALDRAIDAVRRHDLPAADGEVDTWERIRAELRAEILEHGVGEDGALTQTYGNTEVDASLLQVPHTGFLPADDPIMLATVRRIEEDLVDDNGFVLRYRTNGLDGLAGHEAPFVICTFWLVEQYARSGRTEDARRLMDTVLAGANDLGLMSEEYDPVHERMVGNFPQAFSHLGLIRAAAALEGRPVS